MQKESTDIFKSDHAFIMAASSLLFGLGSFLIILGIFCKIIPLGFCNWDLVSLYGGEGAFSNNMTAIILPLGMMIVGIGLRMQNRFGWTVSIILLVFFGFIFLALNGLVLSKMSFLNELAAIPDHDPPLMFPYIKSLITNACFFGLDFAGLIYLFLPPVKELFKT